MTRAELELGIEWAAQEGWNPGLHDADTFHATDPAGFLLGTLDGEPVGMVSAVHYGAGFGFLGFYIVRPAFRGRGHGLALWRAAMQRFAGRVVGLDGVVAQQDNYRRSGFAFAWNNVRYEGRHDGHVAAPAGTVLPLAAWPLPALLDYDAAFFPDDRRRFTQHWIAQRGSMALAAVRDGALAGYGVIRPCRAGCKIGPLFADDARAAADLLHALVAPLPPGTPVQLDVPAPNAEAVALARELGFAPVFETARMFTGAVPALPLDRLFGVTSFELG
ncbi:MAG: GNAT family N-acetyltransferase [Piscinibacter sp.]|nr:GNAT family N-acetyltransferase [Piscinibacter sp.]